MTEVHKRFPEYQSDQREFFDALITEHWDTYQSEEWDCARRFEVERLFKIVRPRTILDIGCGCGFHDAEMAQYSFVESVHAIDYSEKSIEKANEHYPHEKVSRRVADISELPVDKNYDLAVSFQVFEHIANPDEYLQCCRHLVKEGGSIAICTPNWNRLDNRIRSWRKMEPTFVDPQHYTEYTPESLRDIAANHGYRPRAWFGYDITSLMLPQLNKLDYMKRVQIGFWLRRISRVFCMVFDKE